MRTASRATWSGQPWSQAAALPLLDPNSRQLERDADAIITVAERDDYTGQLLMPDPDHWNNAPEERPATPAEQAD